MIKYTLEYGNIDTLIVNTISHVKNGSSYAHVSNLFDKERVVSYGTTLGQYEDLKGCELIKTNILPNKKNHKSRKTKIVFKIQMNVSENTKQTLAKFK